MKSGSTWTYTFLDCTTVDNTLKLWDLTTATELKTLTGHTDYINAIAITWDGQRALCADLESGRSLVSTLFCCTVASTGVDFLRLEGIEPLT